MLIGAVRVRDDQMVLSGGGIGLHVSKPFPVGREGDKTGDDVRNFFADAAERRNAKKLRVSIVAPKKIVKNMRTVRRKSQFINLGLDGRQKTDVARRTDLLHPQTIAFALAQDIGDVFSVRRNACPAYFTAVR
jgi:hypothetical protein